MKTLLGSIILLLIVPHPHLRAADAASARLQQGLFEEEANHNLDAAMTAYQAILTAHEEERKLAATALFRLGECYRKLGRTNDAAAQYQRLLRDFGEQANLTRLSEQNLFALGKAGGPGASNPPAGGLLRLRPTLRERSLIEEQIALTEKQLATVKAMIEKGVQAVDADLPYRQAVARLRRELASLDDPSGAEERKWLDEEISLQEKVVKRARQLIETGMAATGSEIEPQKELLALRREVAALESRGSTPAPARGNEATSPPVQPDALPGFRSDAQRKIDAENAEIRRLESLFKHSPDLVNAGGESPLHQAVLNGQTRVVIYLLDHGTEIDLVNKEGRAPVHIAAVEGNLAMIALLIERKANVNLRANPRYANSTPLQLAAGKGYKSVVESLLAAGADVSAVDLQGKTALHLAAEGNKREVAEVLLAHKADINARDRSGRTPLSTAVSIGQEAFVRMILSRGAEVDTKGADGRTPLVETVARGNDSIAELLLSHRADPNVRFAGKPALFPDEPNGGLPLPHSDVTDLTPLMLAAHGGSAPLVQRLIKAGADVHAVDNRGGAALLWGVRRDRQEVMPVLLDGGADVNRADNYGSTPLEAASLLGRTLLVRTLLDRGANPNQQADHEYPLHTAVRNRHKAVIELLLDSGADLASTDSAGLTALDMAKANAYYGPQRGINEPTISSPELVALLRKRGANEFVPRTGLITFCRVGRGFSQVIFFKGTNNYNHHTLLEFLAAAYSSQSARDATRGFPDLANIRLNRRDPNDGKLRETKIDLGTILEPGARGRDVALQWGDVIEIPELDHRATETWGGFPQAYADRIDELLARQVEFRVKGETNRLTLRSPLPVTPPAAAKPDRGATGFRLRPVLQMANVLRVSSDLSRVTVKRTDPQTKQVRELVFDYSDPQSKQTPVVIREYGTWPNEHTDLWLQDGDVIEVPEKQ